VWQRGRDCNVSFPWILMVFFFLREKKVIRSGDYIRSLWFKYESLCHRWKNTVKIRTSMEKSLNGAAGSMPADEFSRFHHNHNILLRNLNYESRVQFCGI